LHETWGEEFSSLPYIGFENQKLLAFDAYDYEAIILSFLKILPAAG
jgi:hypothetical protein